MLCSPAETWPSVFENTLFDSNPFFLPCAVVGSWGVITSLVMLVILEEPVTTDDVDSSSKGVTKSAPASAHERAAGGAFVPISTHEEGEEVVTRAEIRLPAHGMDDDGTLADKPRTGAAFALVSTLEDGDETPGGVGGSSHASATGGDATFNPLSQGSSGDGESIEPDTIEMVAVGVVAASSALTANKKEPFRLFGPGDSLATVSAYGLLAISQQMGDEALPLFMKLSRDQGGFGFSESDIGQSLAIGGIATTLISLYVVPRMERRWGAPFIFRLGIACMAPLLAFFWVAGFFWGSLGPVGQWVVVNGFVLLKNTCLSISFAGCFVMMTNSVPGHQLGSLNGVGQTFGSLARTVGPALCGVLWSISVKINFIPLTFFLIGASCALTLVVSTVLPPSLRYSLSSSPKFAAEKALDTEIELV